MDLAEQKQHPIFTRSVQTSFYECDVHKNLKLSAMMEYLAETAGIDYNQFQLSHEFLWEQGMVFLISAVGIVVHRRPKAKEALQVSTWEAGTRGAHFLRRFEVVDSDGRTAFESETAWVLVHPQTHRIYRPSQFPYSLPKLPEKTVAIEALRRIEIPPEMDFLGKRKIVYSDIDANGHVNNGIYPAIAYDFYWRALEDAWPENFTARMTFSSEAHLGEILELYGKVLPDRVVVVARKGEEVSFVLEKSYILGS